MKTKSAPPGREFFRLFFLVLAFLILVFVPSDQGGTPAHDKNKPDCIYPPEAIDPEEAKPKKEESELPSKAGKTVSCQSPEEPERSHLDKGTS